MLKIKFKINLNHLYGPKKFLEYYTFTFKYELGINNGFPLELDLFIKDTFMENIIQTI